LNKEVRERLINVTLRVFTMGSKFILIFALARLLTPSDVGLYGLITATVSFSILLIGADYYTYSQRELLARPLQQWSFVIQHQIKALFILYIVFIPIHFLIFIMGFIDWKYAVWFFLLLVVEHISQEIYRLLVAMHKQLIASWVFFIRFGSWVFLLLPLMYFNVQYQNLETLFSVWMMGSLLSIIVGSVAIKKILPGWDRVKTDYAWLKKGFKVGGLFLVSTLCFKALLTFDRYSVEALGSIEMLGVYVFYIGIVMSAFSLLEPAVFSFLYPRMLQAYQAKDTTKYQKLLKELVVSTVGVSVVLALVIWYATPLIILWIDKPIYSYFLSAFIYIIFAGFLYAIGHIPHYALYAMKEDKWIVSAHITAVAIFFTALTLLQYKSGIKVVALALLFSFGWVALVKTVGYIITKKKLSLIMENN